MSYVRFFGLVSGARYSGKTKQPRTSPTQCNPTFRWIEIFHLYLIVSVRDGEAMRHYRCNTCQQTWDLEESTVQAHGAGLTCPACRSPLAEVSVVQAKAAAGADGNAELEGTFLDWLGERFLGAPKVEDPWASGARFVFWCLVAWVSIPFFRLPLRLLDDYHFWINRVNLIFHEAGHMIFGVFGNELLMFLGGGLGQLLMPLMIGAAFFFKNRDCYAAGLGLWWAGQSLVDTSIYINDARALDLTLIGGHSGREVDGHDWNNILTILDCLDQDIYIARTVLLTGRIIMFGGLLWMLVVIARGVTLSVTARKG
ncbi:hypothetical protein [Cerasicoccus maritimus]|uniref:hypothetical protein n=1 Tax=Cerasicoccus maritimus TaxID=490089 RepID=UPI00285287F5|nr:hypothetical protein [Cerasicoccus maritimus]